MEALRKSLALDDKSKDAALAFAALGKLYQEQGLYDLAVEPLTKAIALDPANGEAIIRLAALNARGGKILEAESALTASYPISGSIMFEQVNDFPEP